jgi:UDP-N-acetylmuramoyl-L-alanyl-D-glutamate--2,6-diaminopimelate ligase
MSPAERRVPSPSVELPQHRIALAGLAEVVGAEIRGDAGVLVGDAAYDSRDVPAGSLFFCIPGDAVDGHDFAPAAVAAGASALVVERWLDLEVAQLRVEDVRSAMGPISAEVFGRPAEALTTIGITGTNGKTTITFLLEAVLRAAGVRSGLLGTTGARVDGEPVALERTTPEAPDLHRVLTRMRGAGVRAVAIEVSSHAMAQHRVDGVVFDLAVFTNLSQDHLDYHRSMASYYEAKAALFTPAHASRALIGVDDPWGRRLAAEATIPVTTYGVDADADLRATDVEADVGGLRFRLDGVEVRTRLRGAFNVQNALAALGVARAIGIDPRTAATAIGGRTEIPGRMEAIEAGQEFLVVVDYAHTPDSIRNVLRGARSLAAGRVLVVFGCGGDRDRSKRPAMGAAATAEADLTVITDDNPRSEDPADIIAEVLPGAEAGGGRFVVEPDRRAAIRLAVGEARPGDVVVIAGKGHEPYQEFGGRRFDFDDRTVAREELLALGAEGG